MKIAIIEDDFIIQMFIENIISQTSCEITGTADNFEKAIELVQNTKPDLVILDIGLKGKKDGIETAKIISEQHSIPHIFISGNSDEVTYRKAMETKPLGFIRKPIHDVQLKESILEACEKLKK